MRLIFSFLFFVFSSVILNGQAIEVDSSGNVGVGTSTPIAKLDLRGNSGVSTCLLNLQHSTAGAGTSSFVFFSGNVGGAVNGDALWANNTGNLFISPNASGKKLFLSGGIWTSGGVIIDSSNNIGVGITPTAQLHLSNVIANKKLVLYEGIDNQHQFYGFGISSGILRYQVNDASVSSHVFYAGTGATSSKELMRISGTGNIGIGTSAPSAPLHVKSAGDTVLRIEGPAASMSRIITSDGVDAGYLDYDHTTDAWIIRCNGTEYFRVASTGAVFAGSVQASSFKVGSITLNVPDYVFEKEYKLKTLEEVETAIEKNGHLPGIPSAKEINQNGLDLPDMQLKLLEKVEELTLYAISQHKHIQESKKEIEKLKTENEKLKEKEALIEALLKRVEKLENSK